MISIGNEDDMWHQKYPTPMAKTNHSLINRGEESEFNFEMAQVRDSVILTSEPATSFDLENALGLDDGIQY